MRCEIVGGMGGVKGLGSGDIHKHQQGGCGVGCGTGAMAIQVG